MNRLLTIVDSKYQRLEYLESTGTQYIDTGIAPTNTTGLKCVVSGSSFTGDTNFLGARIQNGERFIINYINGNWGFGFNTFINTNIPADQSIINEFSLNFKNSRKFSANESEYNITSTITGAIPTIYFFAQHTSTGYTTYSYKLHSCQISEGTSIIRNFVPVLRKTDNELGMLDLVEGKFYPNEGTGTFIGSDE